MANPTLLALAALGVSLSAPLQANTPQHQITNDDFFSIATMQNVVLSPDGKLSAWLESRWDKNLDKAQRDIWVINNKTRQTQRLTFSNENESALHWSPDSQTLYFLSKRGDKSGKAPFNAKNQVFQIDAHGGEAIPLTHETDGVKAFQVSDDGKSLYYLGYRTSTDKDPWAKLRGQHQTVQYAHGERDVNPLYQLDLAHYRSTLLLDDDQVVWQFSVNHDGSRIARITTHDNEQINLEGWSHVEIFQPQTGSNIRLNDSAWREHAPSPYGWLQGLAWAADNQRLAFRVDFDGYPGELFVSDTEQPQVAPLALKRQGDMTLSGSQLAWRPHSDELCYRGADHGRTRLYCSQIKAGEQGETRSLIPADTVIGSFSFNANGQQVAYSNNGLTHFSELFLASASRSTNHFKQLTNINPQTADWQLPQISVVSWTSTDGSKVEGILELPPHYKKGDGPLPLVVQLHGGPTSATPYALQLRSYGRATFAADGWALLSPNYRGSVGYGDKFLTQLIGHEHQIEVDDILTGVDKLIDDGIVDGDKLAVMGWSNGGFLTNALISTTKRFKAASVGAGVFDQRLQWMLEDTPGHVINFMQGQPWEKVAEYTAASTLSRASNISTPTLIHVGKNDSRVPKGHAEGLYRALHRYLNVPVELLEYPDEGHGLSSYQHKQAKMAWDKAWFEHYVLGKSLN